MAHSSETPHYFRLISPDHNLQAFRCEREYLTNYLHNDALESTRCNRSRTFLCLISDIAPEFVVGYFTLRAASFSIGVREVLPVAEIVCLARHEDRYGEDWGNVLLSEALAKISQAGRLIGLVGVQLEATEQGRELYTEFGFRDHPVLGGHWMYLSLHQIPEME